LSLSASLPQSTNDYFVACLKAYIGLSDSSFGGLGKLGKSSMQDEMIPLAAASAVEGSRQGNQSHLQLGPNSYSYMGPEML
jgi:hypothetical protein